MFRVENEANNVLTIKTVQIQPIRNMITAIKDVLTDATITYTDNGLKIINFDKTQYGVYFMFKLTNVKAEPILILVCSGGDPK